MASVATVYWFPADNERHTATRGEVIKSRHGDLPVRDWIIPATSHPSRRNNGWFSWFKLRMCVVRPVSHPTQWLVFCLRTRRCQKCFYTHTHTHTRLTTMRLSDLFVSRLQCKSLPIEIQRRRSAIHDQVQ